MIDPGHPRLSIVRQCELVSISRSSFYREPTPESAENPVLMRLIDEQFLETPWYGSRQMARHLRGASGTIASGGTWRWSISGPRPASGIPRHKIYPYLLRHLMIDRPNQAFCADITY